MTDGVEGLPARFTRVREHVRASRQRYVDVLRDFVRIPSVTTDVAQCRAAAQYLEHVAVTAGLRVRADPIPGAGPTLFARGPVPSNSPAVVGYAHYDVKPAGERTAWSYDPWAGEVHDGRLYGRGAVDNKSGCLAFVFAAEACLAAGGLPVDVRLVIEGEDELGSAHLGDWVLSHAAELRGAEGLFCLDGSTEASSGLPRVDLFGRGILYVELSVETAGENVHSSRAVLVHDAAWRLIEALRTIKDVASDRVVVPGWSDDLAAVTDGDREYFREKARDLDVDAVRAQHGLRRNTFPAGRTGEELVRAFYVEPTCTICGLWAGETTPGVLMTAVPRRASAKLDFRCPPRLDAARQAQKLREHLDSCGFVDVEMRVISARTPTWHTEPSAMIVRAIRQAGMEVFGPAWAAERRGPTAEGVFAESLGIPPVLTGFANPDCRIHSPDENLDLDYYVNGIVFAAAVWFRFAQMFESERRR